MNSDVTTDNILRAAERAGLKITTAEVEAARTHIQRQSENFRILSSVNTDGVQPIFGIDSNINAVTRTDE